MKDRIVHARLGRFELVRYDRAGKWCVEHEFGVHPRQQVTLDGAVQFALDVSVLSTGRVYLDRPGGRAFQHRFRVRKGEEGLDD